MNVFYIYIENFLKSIKKCFRFPVEKVKKKKESNTKKEKETYKSV